MPDTTTTAARTPRLTRSLWIAGVLILTNVLLIVSAFFVYPPLRTLPHAWADLCRSIVMLLLYAFALGWVVAVRSSKKMQSIGAAAIRWGMVFAAWEIIHISLENFGHLPGVAESRVTAVFMLGLFFLFGLCGAVQAKIMHARRTAIAVTVFAAIVGMLLVTCFGLSQLFWSFDALAAHDAGDPDFYRSGWTDFHAFVIANILQACFKMWLIGPIAAGGFGAIGSLLKSPFFNTRCH